MLEDHLKNGGAALVVMTTDSETLATKTFLNNLNYGEVQDFKVSDEGVQKLGEAKDVPAPDSSDEHD